MRQDLQDFLRLFLCALCVSAVKKSEALWQTVMVICISVGVIRKTLQARHARHATMVATLRGKRGKGKWGKGLKKERGERSFLL